MSAFPELKAKCLSAYNTFDTLGKQTTDAIDLLAKDINSAGNFLYENKKYTSVKRFGTLLQLFSNTPDPKLGSEIVVAAPEDFLLKVRFSTGIDLAKAWLARMVGDLCALQNARNAVFVAEARAFDVLREEANKKYAMCDVPITFDFCKDSVGMRIIITELSAPVVLDNRRFFELLEQL